MGLSQDLGTAAGFSQLTQGALTNIGSLLGINPADWDIRESQYKGGDDEAQYVKFHVFKNSMPFNFLSPDSGSSPWNGALSQISDIGGRRKVKYKFPYRDGQTTDDLGRDAESFELQIVLFGQNYLDCYDQLIDEFNDPVPGTLIHPVRGEITVGAEKWTVTHKCDQRKAMSIMVTFIEHAFLVAEVTDLDTSPFAGLKSALSAAMGVFSIIDTAINKINGAIALVAGIKNLLNSELNLFKNNSAAALTNMNLTFNAKGGSADIPALLPVNLGGTGKATSASGQPSSGTTGAAGTSGTGSSATTSAAGSALAGIASTSNFAVVSSISDPLNGVPVKTLTNPTAQALAVSQIIKDVQNLTTLAGTIIQTIETNGASLELYDTVISIRQAVVRIQKVLQTGIASSRAQLKTYVTPRLMSLREVMFANKLDVDRVQEIDQLNPTLLSVNYIAKGTSLMVPSK